MKLQKAATKLFATSVGISIILIIATAAYGSWKPRKEKFMDCSMSASCALPV